MIPLLFDVGASEFLVIILLAVILFGPEKLPELVKKAARVIKYLRRVANSATDSLKSELGPEYADLTAADLNPKRLLQRTVLGDVDLADLQTQVGASTQQIAESMTQIDQQPEDLADRQSESDEVDDDLATQVADDSDEEPDNQVPAESEGLIDLPSL